MRLTDTGSGTVVSSDDAANLPPLSLTIHGLSQQDGTPTPSAPVAIKSVQGINIFDQSGVTGGIRQGTSNPNYCYWQDGVLTNVRSIGAHGYWAFDYPMKSPVGTGGLLFISFDVKLGGTNATQQVRVMLQASDSSTAFTNNSYVEVAQKDTWEHFEVVRTVASGYSAGDTCYLVIEAGNTGNSVQLKNVSLSAEHGGYIPFGSVALVSEMGNILDLETELVSAYFISGAAGKKVVDGTGLVSAANTSSDGRSSNYVSSDLFAYLQAGTYTFSWFVVSAGTGASSVVTVRASDSTYITGKTADASVFASDGNVSFTLDAPDTIGIQFKLYNATARFMLTHGTVVPTAYEPYSSTATPIDLQGHAPRSLPSGTEDVLKVDGEGNVTLTQKVWEWDVSSLASYTWQKSSSAINGFYVGTGAFSPAIKIASRGNLYCNMATGRNTTGDYFSMINSSYIDGSVNFNLDAAVVGSNVNDFKTWLATSDLKIVAELATPQTISLGKIDLQSLPSPSFSMHVDAAVTPTLDAE